MAWSIVELSPGSYLAGKVLPVPGAARPVHAYLGIPYARPPVGSLRFQRPEPLTDPSWSGVRDATKFGAICPQPLAPENTTDEDCLFLNVFTPRPPGGHDVMAGDKGLPVMVWIHGGGFIRGCSDSYDGRMLAGRHDVVVVTMNYRLGILGFLSSPDGHLPGNLGLLDQLEALRWVQKHVGKFGGDKNNVTIFGEEAGAVSVALHLVSPLARGLFHRGVCLGGNLDFDKYVKTRESSLEDLSGLDGREVERFLNTLTPEELTSSRFLKQFGIVVDDYYLPGHPIDLYSRGLSHPGVDMMCGLASGQDVDILRMVRGPLAIAGPVDTVKVLRQSLRDNVNTLQDLLCTMQLTGVQGKSEGLVAENRAVLDPFTSSLAQGLNLSRVYAYEFSHERRSRVTSHLGHRESPYVFGEALLSGTATAEGVRRSETFMKYIATFSRYGDPGCEGPVSWPAFTPQTREYLKMGPVPEVRGDFQTRRQPRGEVTASHVDWAKL